MRQWGHASSDGHLLLSLVSKLILKRDANNCLSAPCTASVLQVVLRSSLGVSLKQAIVLAAFCRGDIRDPRPVILRGRCGVERARKTGHGGQRHVAGLGRFALLSKHVILRDGCLASLRRTLKSLGFRLVKTEFSLSIRHSCHTRISFVSDTFVSDR